MNTYKEEDQLFWPLHSSLIRLVPILPFSDEQIGCRIAGILIRFYDSLDTWEWNFNRPLRLCRANNSINLIIISHYCVLVHDTDI